jgi:BASS family bile acid:Na+ symporter
MSPSGRPKDEKGKLDLQQAIRSLGDLIQRSFIWLLVASFCAAAFMPHLGLQLQKTQLFEIHLGAMSIAATTTTLMLSLLLFNAGLVTNFDEVRRIVGRPIMMLGGAIGNFIVPLTFVGGLSLLSQRWHDADEWQQILAGLGFVAAMPIAGASTAWTQASNGNMALSVGLVLVTTLISPFVTPLIILGAGAVTTGDYGEDLQELAAAGSMSFLGAWILAPTLLGILGGRLLGSERATAAKPLCKLANSGIILALNYANGSLSLPNVVAQPDGDFVAVMIAAAALLCAISFSTGFLFARLIGADRNETVSLMFALGLSNSSAGLALASTAMPDHIGVMLTVIIYNLVQYFVAALVDKYVFQGGPPKAQPAAPPPHA